MCCESHFYFKTFVSRARGNFDSLFLTIPGFEGLRCENNINECDGVRCPNNKVCVDLVAAYECRCPVGFSGENCETEINDCISNPCANNGQCVDLQDGFLCNCSEGWTGELNTFFLILLSQTGKMTTSSFSFRNDLF